MQGNNDSHFSEMEQGVSMTLNRLTNDWERWKKEWPAYEIAAKAVEVEVERVARLVGISCRLSSRTKTPSEFVKKSIRKKDEGYLSDPWGMTTDKAGVRVIVDFETQQDELKAALDRESTLIMGVPSDTRKDDPKKLDYRGLHVQVATKLYPNYECELQIRTTAQDLWASVVSHRFLYKPLVDTPFEVKRSLYRLISLVELFDGEVGRAMEEIRKLPEFELVELLDLAEQQLLNLVVQPTFDRQFSLSVLSSLNNAILSTERPMYPELLNKWVNSRQEDLVNVLRDYGTTGGSTEPSYALFTQPEIIIFLERLDNAKLALEREWRAAQLPEELLVTTSAIWADPID